MNTKKPQLSPLELIEGRPGRKTRAESILRLLLSTSYPHAVFGNLITAFAKGYGLTEREDLDELAAELRDNEREMGLYDFIRCLDIQRIGSELTLVAKRLLLDADIKVVKDTVKHHEPFLSANLHLTDVDVLKNPHQLASLLLDTFYKTQVVGKEKNNELTNTRWMYRRKEWSSAPEGDGKKPQLVYRDQAVDHLTAVGVIAESLGRTEFHLILTQDTLLLLDQSSRLWLDSNE